MDQVAFDKLTFARTQLILSQPFFGMLALRLKLVEDPSVKTLCVDGKQVSYNPKFINSLSDGLCRSAIAHEVLHCCFDHMGRLQGRNQKKWNVAADYAINPILKQAKFELGKDWLYDPSLPESADEIYALLPDMPDDKGESDGQPLDELRAGDPAQAEASAVDWSAAAIQAAAAAAKAQGNLPGALQRFIEKLTTPQIDWREQFRNFFTCISQDDFSWQRPDRRYLPDDIFLPTLYSESVGDLVAVIDTSGSIDEDTLNTFGSEVKAIVDSARPRKLHVVYCDTQVQHVDVFEPNDLVTFKLHGGGGTDFRPPFDYLNEHGIKPEALVYLTDMYGPFPTTPPEFPVLWCATSEVAGPFGTTLRIEA